MEISNWPSSNIVRLSSAVSAELPLIKVNNDFWIYSFDMMGKHRWNLAAANTLEAMIRENGSKFDIFVTAEAKAIGLTENLVRLFDHDEYVVLRKSIKAYMENPATVDVKSITTESLQQFYLGQEKFSLLKGKRVCVVDDVVSTGGTLEAFFQLSEKVGFEIALIACALTEGKDHESYRGVNILRIGNIPLPKAT
ncbi:MAG: adenine phosphoribosyltransferase [Clostridiales Family XIII bacterium]|jgi:adenine phosphoribosyltransferase|nr:adenine phosphoribosyltransferase [Clostridiales Family XIII bacterium]